MFQRILQMNIFTIFFFEPPIGFVKSFFTFLFFIFLSFQEYLYIPICNFLHKVSLLFPKKIVRLQN